MRRPTLGPIFGLMVACSEEGAGPDRPQGEDAGSLDAAGADASPPGPDGGRDLGPSDMTPSFGLPSCDVVIEANCFLPYPSNLPIVVDPTSPTGFGLNYFDSSFPINREMQSFDPRALAFLDGVPIDISVLSAFDGVDPTSLPGPRQISASLASDASILLFELNPEDFSLARVPYWVDVDPRAPPEDEMLFVRPARVLTPGRRYIIAFRNLRRPDGSFLPRSAGFDALVRGRTDGSEIEQRQPLFDDLLGLLDEAGVELAEVQAAWDFRTATKERQLFQVEEALAAFRQWRAETSLSFSRFLDEEGAPEAEQTFFAPESPWRIQFDGVMRVPDFLAEAGFRGQPVRGLPSPQPQVLGEREVPFRIRVGRAALTEAGNEPAPVLLLGHPLGGSRDFLDAPEWASLAETLPLILVIADWPGLSANEAPLLELALQDANGFTFVAQNALQGWVEQLVLAEVARAFLSDGVIRGEINVEPEAVGFVGVGLTGSLGAGLVAASSVMERGALVSSPADLGLAFSRSEVLAPLLYGEGGMVDGYESARRAWIMTEVVRSLFSSLSNPNLFSQLASPTGDFVGGRILWTAALSDPRVSSLDLERMARSGLIPLMENYPRQVQDVTPASYPRAGSGTVVFDFGQGFPPPDAVPPPETPGDDLLALDAHGQLILDFVRTGTISDPCGGAPCRF